jgi:hypothetical protein
MDLDPSHLYDRKKILTICSMDLEFLYADRENDRHDELIGPFFFSNFMI